MATYPGSESQESSTLEYTPPSPNFVLISDDDDDEHSRSPFLTYDTQIYHRPSINSFKLVDLPQEAEDDDDTTIPFASNGNDTDTISGDLHPEMSVENVPSYRGYTKDSVSGQGRAGDKVEFDGGAGNFDKLQCHRSTSGVNRQSSIAKDVHKLSSIFRDISADAIEKKLKEMIDEPNRVEIVTNLLLEEQERDPNGDGRGDLHSNSESNDFESVFADVSKVLHILTTNHHLQKLPDENIVFEVLEQFRDKLTRVEMTVNYFVGASSAESMVVGAVGAVEVEDDVIDGSIREGGTDNLEFLDNLAVFSAHPLFQDLNTVAKVFPHRDPNEIMAYLEAYHDRPDRIQLVSEELLNLVNAGESQNSNEDQSLKRRAEDVEFVREYTKRTKLSSHEDNSPNVLDARDTRNSPTPNPDNLKSMIDQKRLKSKEDFEILKSLVPDADPNYIFECMERMKDNPNRVTDLANEMLEKRNYPKLEDVLQSQKKNAMKQQIMGCKFKMEEFLKLFDDPVEHFYNESKSTSVNYTKHALAKLKNEFPMLTEDYITAALKKHKNHFTPTWRELEQDERKVYSLSMQLQLSGRRYTGFGNRRKYRLKPRSEQEPWPEELDEMFFKELQFVQHEEEIADVLDDRRREREKRINEARQKGALEECGCCYEDEILFEEMLACPDGHLFCRNCIKRSAQEVIGQGRVAFPCLSADCSCQLTIPVLQQVLLPSEFSSLLKRIQEEEIRQADIPNLETCPFCHFATIMDNPDDKVFKCQNTDCLKETCRLCKEVNHIPLRCEEVEKEGETKKRLFIEDQMTNAMLRTCWKCKKKFFKEDGCNKMTCQCGASMCYICRQPIKGYEHFGTGPGQCPPTLQNIDHKTFHLKEVAAAGEKAKTHYSHSNPHDPDLKYDPIKTVQKDLDEATTANNTGMPFQNAPGMFIGFPFVGAPFMPPMPPPPPPPPPLPPLPPLLPQFQQFQFPVVQNGNQVFMQAPGQVAAQGPPQGAIQFQAFPQVVQQINQRRQAAQRRVLQRRR